MKQLYLFLFIVLCFATNNAFSQSYCPVSFPGGVSAITEVRFETMTNVSATNSTSDYEDFTAIADTVLSGINITLLVNGTTAGNFTDSVMAYLDYNQDGDFTDTGERISIGAITNATGSSIGSAIVKDITIPTTTVGNLRMRIVKKRFGGNSPCNNSGIGQAEDYNLFVLAAAPPCSGTPWAGTAASPVSSVCGGESFAIQLSAYTHNTGITIQWESSPLATPGYWSPIPGATSSILIVPAISEPMTYHADVACINCGIDISNTATLTTPATYVGPIPPFICIGDTINVTAAPCSTCALTITGPNNFTGSQSFTIPNASLANNGWYYTSTTDNSCSTVNYDSFYVNVVNCADSVWPGDANNDLITNYVDALHVALYNGVSGYARPNASISYTSQFCLDWSLTGINNLNLKHVDCNGDGTVNPLDISAVHQNYNQQHLKGGYLPKQKVSSLPDLYFDTTGIQFLPNTPVMIPVKLGTQAYPMNDILGLGGEIKISGMPMSAPMHIDHSYQTWIGYYSSINFEQTINNYQTDFVHCRYDHFPRSGYGTIGHLFFSIPASAAGDTVTLYFDNVVIIDSAGDVLTNYNVLPATFIIKDPLGIKGLQSVIDKAEIIPNPSTTQAELLVCLNENTKLLVTVLDITGRTIWKTDRQLSRGAHRIYLPHNLSTGVYQIVIYDQSPGRLKTLKWVKQ